MRMCFTRFATNDICCADSISHGFQTTLPQRTFKSYTCLLFTQTPDAHEDTHDSIATCSSEYYDTPAATTMVSLTVDSPISASDSQIPCRVDLLQKLCTTVPRSGRERTPRVRRAQRRFIQAPRTVADSTTADAELISSTVYYYY